MSSRVFIGRLSRDASERDVEDFFRGYGRIRDIVLKNGFGFAEFESSRDADDAIHDLNGKDLAGERVTLEFSKGSRGGDRRGGFDRDRGYRGGYDGGRSRGERSRFGPPVQTRYRMIVENLSTRISWQDLKDIMRKNGCDVSYADAHKREHEAVVCFATRNDLERAMDKLQGEEFNGRKIKLIDDSGDARDRSRSRSRSSRSKSRSRSRSHRSSRSRSHSRSKSRSKSRSRSRNGSPKKNGRDRSMSRSRSANKDRSGSPAGSDRSRSGSPADD